MFDGNKYVTTGVTDHIPQYIQNLLWFLIEVMKVDKKDYLQVFTLEEVIQGESVIQKIIHQQEQPEYIKTHMLPVHTAVNAKVYIIDDTTRSTMLLAHEY